MSGFFGIMFPGGGAGGLPPVTPSTYVAVSSATANKRITVYNWDSTVGFGSVFSSPSIPYTINQVSFTRDNSVIAGSIGAAPHFNVWQWSTLGFGTQYSNAGSPLNPGQGGPAGFTWTNNVDAILTSNVISPSFPQAWAWSSASGFGTKYSNATSVNTTGGTTGVALNADNTQVAFSQNTSPIVSLFPWSSASGFGTRYSNPATVLIGSSYAGSVAFNAATNDLAFGLYANRPFVAAYAVTPSGFGSKYADPVNSFQIGAVLSVRFAPNGATLAVGNNATPNSLRLYQWGGGFASLYSGPSLLQTTVSADWSSTGSEVISAQSTSSPYLKAFPWTIGGVGTAYSNPGTAPGVANCVSFSNQSR